MNKHETHVIIQAIQEVASELGHAPSKREFTKHSKSIHHSSVISRFKTWSAAVIAAGMTPNEPTQKKSSKKEKKFKYKKSLIDSFVVHELDTSGIFKDDRDYIDIIAMPDTHVKNRDNKAVTCFLSCLEKIQADVFVILGDFLDAEGISHWPTDSLEPKRFIPEILDARELLDAIDRRLPPGCVKAFLCGNHEDWLRQAMVSKMPELFDGLAELGLMPDIEKLLELSERGYSFFDVNHFLKIGPTYYTHGLYTGANHPAKHLKVTKATVYYGHLHDDLSASEPSISGFVEAASCGCLCRLDAPFMKGKPTNWAHGFRHVRLFKNGKYISNQIKIKDGKAVFFGQDVGSF